MAVWGILSDVHGNVRALEAVLRELERDRPDGIFCLGDLVGYCAEPNACVELARERGFRALLGNHELVALGELGFERCAPRPAHALAQTRRTLDDASRTYLRAMPRSLAKGDDSLFVHGSVLSVCEYMSNHERIAANARALALRYPRARYCYFGHTHVASAYECREGAVVRRDAEDTVVLAEGATWFINPGAVDGSRAPEPGARFAVLDDRAGRVSFRRAAYDHRACERDAVRLGYRPNRAFLAKRASRDFLEQVANRAWRTLCR